MLVQALRASIAVNDDDDEVLPEDLRGFKPSVDSSSYTTPIDGKPVDFSNVLNSAALPAPVANNVSTTEQPAQPATSTSNEQPKRIYVIENLGEITNRIITGGAKSTHKMLSKIPQDIHKLLNLDMVDLSIAKAVLDKTAKKTWWPAIIKRITAITKVEQQIIVEAMYSGNWDTVFAMMPTSEDDKYIFAWCIYAHQIMISNFYRRHGKVIIAPYKAPECTRPDIIIDDEETPTAGPADDEDSDAEDSEDEDEDYAPTASTPLRKPPPRPSPMRPEVVVSPPKTAAPEVPKEDDASSDVPTQPVTPEPTMGPLPAAAPMDEEVSSTPPSSASTPPTFSNVSSIPPAKPTSDNGSAPMFDEPPTSPKRPASPTIPEEQEPKRARTPTEDASSVEAPSSTDRTDTSSVVDDPGASTRMMADIMEAMLPAAFQDVTTTDDVIRGLPEINDKIKNILNLPEVKHALRKGNPDKPGWLASVMLAYLRAIQLRVSLPNHHQMFEKEVKDMTQLIDNANAQGIKNLVAMLAGMQTISINTTAVYCVLLHRLLVPFTF